MSLYRVPDHADPDLDQALNTVRENRSCNQSLRLLLLFCVQALPQGINHFFGRQCTHRTFCLPVCQLVATAACPYDRLFGSPAKYIPGQKSLFHGQLPKSGNEPRRTFWQQQRHLLWQYLGTGVSCLRCPSAVARNPTYTRSRTTCSEAILQTQGKVIAHYLLHHMFDRSVHASVQIHMSAYS